MITVKAIIEMGTDGTYGVYIDLEEKRLSYGIIGDGNTVQEAVADFKNSYEEMKEYYAEKDKKFQEVEFEYQYDMASFLNYISGKITLSGLQRITGVNQGQLSNYLNGHRRPSKRTIHKIEHSIHSFGKEISQMKFV